MGRKGEREGPEGGRKKKEREERNIQEASKAKLKQADREGWGEGGLRERRERQERGERQREEKLPAQQLLNHKRARYFLQLTSKIFYSSLTNIPFYHWSRHGVGVEIKRST